MGQGDDQGQTAQAYPHMVRRRPRLREILVALLLLPVIVFGPFVVLDAAGVLGPVPPGDTYALTVRNDTGRSVEVFVCGADDCTRGYSQTVLAAGTAEEVFNVAMVDPSDAGVADPATHTLRGCLTPAAWHPGDRGVPSKEVAVTRLHPCPGPPPGAHVVVRFVDPAAL